MPSTVSEEIEDLKDSKWQLVDRFGLDAQIEFDNELKILRGYNGCNDFTADITLKNYLIEFSKFKHTERYCESLNDADREFLVSLSKVHDFEEYKNKLVLHTASMVYIGGKKASTLTFLRVEE